MKGKEITITKVKENNGWLNCMSPYPVKYDGKYYRTCEALFQALRFENYSEIQEEIRECKSPMGAKMKARRNRELLQRGELWDQASDDPALMKMCLQLKLEQHPRT